MATMRTYIADVETNERIEVFASDPLQNQVSAQYQPDPIRGRSTPQVGYINTDEDVYSITIYLAVAPRMQDAGAPVDARALKDQISFLKSFNYPDYGEAETQSRAVKPPHRIMYLRGEQRMVGYMSGWSHQELRPYDVATGLPMAAEVSFQLHELPESPRGLRDVREWWKL